MSDYNRIEDIVAGINNATQLRTNIKQDDGTDTVTGIDWFTYNGIVCNNIYASGNSWIGFGTSSEHLKVNRRDAAMWNLWREEGTYLSYYKFLRIRWSGYTTYSATSTSYLLTYDVILFDTGDIMLYVVDVPTSNYNGAFTFGSSGYVAPSANNRYVTFYLQDDGSYTVEYAPISLVSPYATKYLIRDGDTLYTIIDGALSEIAGELNADFFLANGFDNIPPGTLLMSLTAPEVLCWTESSIAPKLKVTVQGVPDGAHYILSDNIRIGHSSVYGITSVEALASEGATFQLSFDGGEWMIYDASSETFVASDEAMTATELVTIPTNVWSSVVNSANYMRLKAILDGTDTVTQVKFNFNNESPVEAVVESEG